jgi:hypothetical protein
MGRRFDMPETDPVTEGSTAADELFAGRLPIQEALAKLRLRLLDLTSRNRLLNFKHSPGKSLQFVHSVPEGGLSKCTDALTVSLSRAC